MKSKKIVKRILALLTVLVLVTTGIAPVNVVEAATKKVKATNITITNKVGAKKVIIGDEFTLETKMKPAKATDKVTWSSNDSSIVKVNKKGNIKALKVGKAKITAKTKSGKKASVTVKVLDTVTVSTQKELKSILGKKNLSSITIKTTEAVTFSIPVGTYTNTQLVVNAPNADIINRALFKNIRIDAIKSTTWTEMAKGNTFNIIAPESRLIVKYGAEVKDILLEGNNAEIVLEGQVSGNITFVENTKTELNLNGTTSSDVNIVVNGTGAKLVTSLKASVKLNTDAQITFDKGAEGSSLIKENNNIKETLVNNSNEEISISTGDKKPEATEPTGAPTTPTVPTTPDTSGGGGGGFTPNPTTVPTTESTTASTTEPTTVAPTEPSSENPDALKNAFKDYFSVGNAVNFGQLKDSSTLEHIKEHYNSITMENEMKPDAILGYTPVLIDKANAEFPVPSSYTESKVPKLNFTKIDEILKIAKDNGLPVRGHTLVWHSQTPSWFFRENYSTTGTNYVSKEIMDQRMEYYIQQVLLHVQKEASGVIYAWDVVNEIYDNNGTALRLEGDNNVESGKSLWMKIYKDDSFAVNAFAFARKYAEDGVKLFYNDYNEYISAKTIKIYDFVKKLYDEGNIDGVGMQSHLDVKYPTIADIGKAIDKFASVGTDFEIQLTEIDVTINYNENNGHTLDDQGEYYKALTDMLLTKKKANVNITNITYWGLYDEVSWRKEGQPLLFKEGFVPKAAYTSVINSVKAFK